jgi:hypothetical protein
MKIGRQIQQRFTDKIEKEPGYYDPQNPNYALPQKSVITRSGIHPLRQLPQTGRADRPVIVLRNALATEKMTASGATRDGFPSGMMETALSGQTLHAAASGPAATGAGSTR